MSQNNEGGGIFDSISNAIGNFTMDDFQVLAGTALEFQKARNQDPRTSRADTVALATTPQTTDPNPEMEPVSANQIRHAAVGRPVPLEVGGFRVDKNILIGAGVILGAAVLLKVLK